MIDGSCGSCERTMGQPIQERYDNFDMTLDECRLVLDTVDNMVIVDAEGRLKYLSPNMIPILRQLLGREVPEQIAGAHISEIHPISKLQAVLQEGKGVENAFYFVSGTTNVARIKPLYREGNLVGAIDYDIFSDGVELKEFLNQVVDYSIKGFLNLRETVEMIQETGKRLEKVKYCISDFLGESEAARELRLQISHLGETDSTVMIRGATGCGKEVVAHAIHNISRRSKKPMVEINCAAIPDTLVESELFGYEEGAFTGASRGGKAGKFEMADGGTLFLDEVNSLPYHIQPKLLRALQEKEVTRIGGKPKMVDIRVIAATNQDLWKLVEEGKFREDLYYRLNVIELQIPTLAQRREDIPLLVQHQLNKLNRQMVRRVERVSDEVMALFESYDWPGNVRELNNILERAMNLCQGDILEMRHLGDFVTKALRNQTEVDMDAESPLELIRAQAEWAAIQKALEITGGNRTQAAKMLKISRTSLYEKLEKYVTFAEKYD